MVARLSGLLTACLFVFLSPLLWADTPPLQQTKPIVLDHVAVIDTSGGPVQLDMVVVIQGGRIADMGKAGTLTLPKEAEVIDGAGKFLIPSLWDMHVHFAGKFYLPLFLANGVTGIRDMYTFSPDMIFHMREDVKKGSLLGPRIVAAGTIVDGPKPFWPGSIVAGNEEQGTKAVLLVKKSGADFVKVYSKLPRSAYLAIAAQAKKEGLTFAGHVPVSMSAAEASDLGQKSMEHLYGIAIASSTEEDRLRSEETEAAEKLDNAGLRALMIRTQSQALDTFSDQKAKALFARFAKNGTWQVPTLTVLRAVASLDDEKFVQDPRLKYMPSYLSTGWKRQLPRETSAGFKRSYRKAGDFVHAMHDAGVPFLAGTDTTNPFCFPGFSLHDELALLVQDGKFTPLQALQTATINPARFLGLEHDLGTVAKGKLADLVLLESNPLDDIHNTTRIAAVVVAGKLLAKPELEKMLGEVEAANKK